MLLHTFKIFSRGLGTWDFDDRFCLDWDWIQSFHCRFFRKKVKFKKRKILYPINDKVFSEIEITGKREQVLVYFFQCDFYIVNDFFPWKHDKQKWSDAWNTITYLAFLRLHGYVFRVTWYEIFMFWKLWIHCIIHCESLEYHQI